MDSISIEGADIISTEEVDIISAEGVDKISIDNNIFQEDNISQEDIKNMHEERVDQIHVEEVYNILIDKTIDEEAANILSCHGNVEILDTANVDCSKLSKSEVICVRTNTNVDKKYIDSAPNLKIIATATTGTNHIDLEYAKLKGINIIDAKGANADSVADYVFRILFMITDDAYYTNALLKEDPRRFLKLKKENFRTELASFSIGIIGLGNIGSRVARRADAFGMSIYAFDPYVDTAVDKLDDVMKCDIVTIHAELTDETKGMIDTKKLMMLKNGAILINAARAEIIEENALKYLMEKRQDVRVIMDVFYDEPEPNWIYNVKDIEGCTVTPHIAGNAIEAKKRAACVIADRISECIKNKLIKSEESQLSSEKSQLSKNLVVLTLAEVPHEITYTRTR